MSKFFIGQRVRIKYSYSWPYLKGEEGTIVSEPAGFSHCSDVGDWFVAPDIWGSCECPVGSSNHIYGGSIFNPYERQLEPITNIDQSSAEFASVDDLIKFIVNNRNIVEESLTN